MLDISRIRSVVNTARQWDFELSEFGTWGHVHHFLPVLPEEELGLWEEEMGLTLPADYRAYLTRLGNGGAGPAYGLMPFRLKIAPNLRKPCIYSEDREAALQETIRRFIHWYEESEDDWDLYLEYFPDTPDWKRQGDWKDTHYKEWSDELEVCLDRTVVEPLTEHGQIFIANEGCSGDMYLILNGSHRGYCHWCSTDCDPGNVFKEPITFAAYRDGWLQETFADYLMQYVNKMDDFCKDLPDWKRRQFQWEREGVRDFYAAAQAGDWEGAVRLLTGIHAPAALSNKTRCFYACYEETLLRLFPGDQRVIDFYHALFRYKKHHFDNNFVHFKQPGNEDSLYPRISFKEFVQDFLEE